MIKAITRVLTVGFFFSGLVLFQWGCTRTDSKVDNALVMGLCADYPPFEFKKNGEFAGFDIDLAHEIARKLGYTLKIQDLDFSALIPSLQSGRVDFVMSGMTISEERKKNIEFSEVYFLSSFALIVPQASPFLAENQFQGKRVGVQLGSTMEKFAKEMSKDYSDMKIVALGKNPVLIQELKSGRLDGVLSEEVQARAFVEANPSLKFAPLSRHSGDGYAIAFPKGEKAVQLREKMNLALSDLRKSGKLEEIKTRWMAQ